MDTWIPPEADPEVYKTQQSPQNYMQQNLQLVRRMQAATQVTHQNRIFFHIDTKIANIRNFIQLYGERIR